MSGSLAASWLETLQCCWILELWPWLQLIFLIALQDTVGVPVFSKPGELPCCVACVCSDSKLLSVDGDGRLINMVREQGCPCEKQRGWPAHQTWPLHLMLRADDQRVGMDVYCGSCLQRGMWDCKSCSIWKTPWDMLELTRKRNRRWDSTSERWDLNQHKDGNNLGEKWFYTL